MIKIFLVLVVPLWLAHIFTPSGSGLDILAKWGTFFLEHFFGFYLIFFSIFALVGYRKQKERLLKVLMVVMLVAFVPIQIKALPIFFSDWNYYNQHGLATVIGKVTDTTHAHGGQNIYLNGETNGNGEPYSYFWGGGIHEGDIVILYHLPASRSIFYHSFLINTDLKNPS